MHRSTICLRWLPKGTSAECVCLNNVCVCPNTPTPMCRVGVVAMSTACCMLNAHRKLRVNSHIMDMHTHARAHTRWPVAVFYAFTLLVFLHIYIFLSLPCSPSCVCTVAHVRLPSPICTFPHFLLISLLTHSYFSVFPISSLSPPLYPLSSGDRSPACS